MTLADTLLAAACIWTFSLAALVPLFYFAPTTDEYDPAESPWEDDE